MEVGRQKPKPSVKKLKNLVSQAQITRKRAAVTLFLGHGKSKQVLFIPLQATSRGGTSPHSLITNLHILIYSKILSFIHPFSSLHSNSNQFSFLLNDPFSPQIPSSYSFSVWVFFFFICLHIWVSNSTMKEYKLWLSKEILC